MQSIILIGKLNVGKSSFFNHIVRRRIAITSEIPGATRDTNKIKVSINGKETLLIDSGGLDESNELFKNVKQNSPNAAKNADIILYLVDGKNLPDEEDRKLLYALKELQEPMTLIINKVDNKKDEERVYEFVNFGAKEFSNLLVIHSVGLDELYAWLEKLLHTSILKNDEEEQSLKEFLENLDEEKQTKFKKIDENHIKIGIAGRVNIGKSSLLNALVKEQRSVAGGTAGTTIDLVNESVMYKDKLLKFIGTVGIRKRRKIQGLERFALNRTEKMLENSQIAFLVLDANKGFNEFDEHIAELISKHYLGVITVLNKWDRTRYKFDKVVKGLKLDHFKFLAHAPVVNVSALSGRRMHILMDKILEVFASSTQKIPIAKFNDLANKVIKAHPLPHDCGKSVKIYYVVQYDLTPPKIALIMNHSKALYPSYKRYLQNQIRKGSNFEGVPSIFASRKEGTKENE